MPKRPPAGYRTVGEVLRSLASFTSMGRSARLWAGRDHEDTEQGSHAQLSIQAPEAWAHTASAFCRVSVSPEILAADKGLRWGGLKAPSPGPGSSQQPTGPALGPLP